MLLKPYKGMPDSKVVLESISRSLEFEGKDTITELSVRYRDKDETNAIKMPWGFVFYSNQEVSKTGLLKLFSFYTEGIPYLALMGGESGLLTQNLKIKIPEVLDLVYKLGIDVTGTLILSSKGDSIMVSFIKVRYFDDHDKISEVIRFFTPVGDSYLISDPEKEFKSANGSQICIISQIVNELNKRGHYPDSACLDFVKGTFKGIILYK